MRHRFESSRPSPGRREPAFDDPGTQGGPFGSAPTPSSRFQIGRNIGTDVSVRVDTIRFLPNSTPDSANSQGIGL